MGLKNIALSQEQIDFMTEFMNTHYEIEAEVGDDPDRLVMIESLAVLFAASSSLNLLDL